jgi:hypothetical protein
LLSGPSHAGHCSGYPFYCYQEHSTSSYRCYCYQDHPMLDIVQVISVNVRTIPFRTWFRLSCYCYQDHLIQDIVQLISVTVIRTIPCRTLLRLHLYSICRILSWFAYCYQVRGIAQYISFIVICKYYPNLDIV